MPKEHVHRRFLRFAFTVATIAASASLFGGDEICDQGLTPDPGDNGYKWRSNRCEGTYIHKVAGSINEIRIAGFFRTYPDVTISPSVSALRGTWSLPAANSTTIVLRGQSMTSGHSYRIDSQVNNDSYVWPTDVLRALRIPLNEIGFVAYTSTKANERLYLPTSLT